MALQAPFIGYPRPVVAGSVGSPRPPPCRRRRHNRHNHPPHPPSRRHRRQPSRRLRRHCPRWRREDSAAKSSTSGDRRPFMCCKCTVRRGLRRSKPPTTRRTRLHRRDCSLLFSPHLTRRRALPATAVLPDLETPTCGTRRLQSQRSGRR